jgi:Tol biopolymer transport system component
MSIDARIREGLAMIEKELPRVDTIEGYDDLERDISRNARRRWTIVGAAAAAVVAALVTSVVVLNQGNDAGLEPAPQPKLPTDVIFFDADGRVSYIADDAVHTLSATSVDRFAVSPDGTEIAYTTEGDARRHLWIANLDGTDARQLPAACNGCEPGYGVAWSRDGTRLAYVEWTPGQRRVQIRIQTLATGEEQVLKMPAGLEPRGPRFSPDDQLLAVNVAEDSGQYVATVSPAEGVDSLTRLGDTYSQVQAPSWSEDGQSVYFTATTSGDNTNDVTASIDLYAIAVDGSGLRKITSADEGERYFAATQYKSQFLISRVVGSDPWNVGWLSADDRTFTPMKDPDGEPVVGSGAQLLP